MERIQPQLNPPTYTGQSSPVKSDGPSQTTIGSSGVSLGNSNPQEVKIVAPEDRLATLTDIYGEKRMKQMGFMECATCSSRRYVDGSDDPGVSFKTPANISPEASFSAVSSHEQEHVSNERASAQAENREVVSQNVKIFSDICPECGRTYASGGVTTTVTASKTPAPSHYQSSPEKKGNLLDARV